MDEVNIYCSISPAMMTTRLATVADIALITAHRRAMFAEMGTGDDQTLGAMERSFSPWVERMLTTGKYVGWIVEDGGQPVASGGFVELEWPPHPLDPEAGARGYLLNFWVEPAYRGKGLAKGLAKQGLAESRKRGLRVTVLHASGAGKPVYSAVGFCESNEMLFVDSAAM
jgi:ribosomal protein S18 acetylase RimI-like enzyme